MIKKSIMTIIIILMLTLLVGCLDYKAYDNSNSADSNSDDLLNEIAQIENELGLANNEEVKEDEIVEEVVLPNLQEEDLQSEVPDVINVKENDLVTLKVKVVDPDQDVVTYSFSKPLDENGQWKTNYGDAGEYFVTISATDGVHTTEKTVKIDVERVNVPPIIAALTDVTVKEGEVVEFQPDVKDPNNDPLTIKVTEPLKEGRFATDHTSEGQYQIIVSATDGELASEASFKLTVINVNELPVISGLENINVKEGEVINLKPVVTDLDEDEITITISEPVGDDGVWETSFTDHGEYVVTVIADDGKDKVRHNIKIVVEDVNMPPEIVEVSLSTS
ncbi:MAG: hypothetical protein ABIH82_03495 [Candidatus Woesearchaeota archaeon]